MATSELKKILSQGAIYAIGALLARLISLLMLPVYTRALSPAEYGVVDLLDTTAAVIVNLANVAITYSLMRFYHDAQGARERGCVVSTAMGGLLASGVLAVLIVWPLALPLSRAMFGSNAYAGAVHLMALTAVLYGLIEVPMTFIRALERPWLYLAVSIGRLLLGLALNVALVVWLRWGVMGVVWANVLTCIVTVVFLGAFTLPRTGIAFSPRALFSMLAFGLPFIPGALAMLVLHNGDRYILAEFRPLAEVGLYSLGYKLGMILSYAISVPFFNVWSTRMYAVADAPDGMRSYGKVATYYVYVLFFAWVALASAANELVSLAASREFSGAAAFVPLVALGYVVRDASEFWRSAFLIRKKTRYLAWMQPMTAAANLLLTWVLVRAWGAIGAAWATLLTFVLLFVLSFVPAERMLPSGVSYRRVALGALIAAAIFAIARGAPSMPLVIALPFKLMLTLSFPVALYALGALPTEDRAKLSASLRRVWARARGARAAPARGSFHP